MLLRPAAAKPSSLSAPVASNRWLPPYHGAPETLRNTWCTRLWLITAFIRNVPATTWRRRCASRAARWSAHWSQPLLDFRRGYARCRSLGHAIATRVALRAWPPPSLPGLRSSSLAAEPAGPGTAALLAEPRPRPLSAGGGSSSTLQPVVLELTRIAPAALRLANGRGLTNTSSVMSAVAWRNGSGLPPPPPLSGCCDDSPGQRVARKRTPTRRCRHHSPR